MLLLPIACVTGLAAGRLTGGRVRHLASLHLRGVGVAAAALAFQLALPAVPHDLRFPVVLCSYGAVGAWLVANTLGRPSHLRLALALLAAGWMLNFAVISVNRGMPVSLDAARQVGARPGVDVTRGNLSKHVPLVPGTALAPLGDVIPVRPLGTVVSAGDVAMSAGVVLAVAGGMLPRTSRCNRSRRLLSVGDGTEISGAHSL